MKEKKKQSYLSPELTVVQFRVERGYAASGETFLEQLFLFREESDANHTENYITRDGWDRDGSFF